MDLVDIIHSSLMYTLKRRPIKETMCYILSKIISASDDDYGFIGEVMCRNNSEDKFIRYHAVHGFDDTCLQLLETFGHLDFDHLNCLHDRCIKTKRAFYLNNIKRKVFPQGHKQIAKFIAIPLIKDDEVFGLLGLGKGPGKDLVDYNEDSIKILKPVSMVIGSTLLHIKDLVNLSYQKDMFLANVSHEIRTPLNGIVCLTKLLTKTKCTTDQENYIKIIRQCSVQLLEIVNDILDYSKIGNDKISLHHKPVSLKKVVESALDVVRFKAMEKELYLNYILEEKLPNKIIADNTRLCQVLVNLLSNSIKFTKKGHVILRVSLESVVGSQYTLHFIVEDTGIGIPKNKIDSIFDTFQQIPNNYIAGSAGVGLGLPISKHLVSLFNGKMWAESESSVGTKMHFNIRVKKFAEAIDIKKLTQFYTGKNVLIIDNDPETRKILFSTLVELGIRPVISNTMNDANMYLVSDIFTFEFIIVNIAYVDTDDIDRLNRIKDNSVKIILVDQENDIKIQSVDYDYTVYKPINRNKLESVFNLIFVERKTNSPDRASHKFITDRTIEIKNKPKTTIEISESTKRNNLRILVAEDIKTNQQVILTMLKSLGYENVTIVGNGLELIDELQTTTKEYSIVFVDLKMPEMDGITASKKIITNIPQHKYGQLIALTASVSNKLRDKCYEVGMTSYITKPIDIEKLEGILKSCTSG